MNPLDQFFEPLIGPPGRLSITTNPGRLSLADPRTERGAATLQPTRVHHEQPRPVYRRFGRHRVHERYIIDAVAQMREEIAHILAALAPLTKFPPRLDNA